MAISDHPFLAGRDAGTSRRLDQNICLAVTFVDSPAGQWTEKDRAAFLLLMMQGASLLTHTMPGKKLFQLQETVTVPGSFEAELSRGVLPSSGFGSLSALSEARRRAGERRYGVSFSQAPLLFVFHGRRKSYTVAHRRPGDSRDEYSVFYSRDPGLSPGGIARALLCQFGAVDYSADAELLALARACFGDGLMLGQDAAGSALDPLNRYLVGQTDSLGRRRRNRLFRRLRVPQPWRYGVLCVRRRGRRLGGRQRDLRSFRERLGVRHREKRLDRRICRGSRRRAEGRSYRNGPRALLSQLLHQRQGPGRNASLERGCALYPLFL